jgi:hypothetical protein
MTRKTTKRRKSNSSVPFEVPRETTALEPVQPEETQGIPDESREESANVGYEALAEVEEHDPTPATPVESAHTTPSSEPRRRQEDEESDPFDVDFDEGSNPLSFRDDERPRQRSFSEDEADADAYFKQYVTTSFHPDDKAADNKIHVIYPLVTQPPEYITIQAVPNLTAQERQSAAKVRDHRRTRYKTRFWPLYAMSYHKANRFPHESDERRHDEIGFP